MSETKTSVEQRDVLLLSPTCDVVASNEASLRNQWEQAIAAGAAAVTIDLRAVGMIDSTGLGLFVSCYKTVNARGGALTIVTDNPDFQQLFNVTRLDRFMEIRESL